MAAIAAARRLHQTMADAARAELRKRTCARRTADFPYCASIYPPTTDNKKGKEWHRRMIGVHGEQCGGSA